MPRLHPLLFSALTLLMLLIAPVARADTCGANNERPCGVTERIPSCDMDLVEAGGACHVAACGAAGQRPCGPTERFVFDFILQAPVPKACNANLLATGNPAQCTHPACGQLGQAACNVLQRIPSCDIDLVEKDGRCAKPLDCGGLNQPPCGVLVRGPLFACDVNLVVRAAVCARPGAENLQTAPTTQTASPSPTRAAAGLPSRSGLPVLAPVGIEIDTDRAGSDLISFELAGTAAAQCQALCASSGQCRAWSFVKPGAQGPNARCYLKSSAPAATKNTCCASGVKAGANLLAPNR